MAQIQEERIVFKLSRLTKADDKSAAAMVDVDLVKSLEAAVQELVGDRIIVEVEAIE